jgi:hypothetical protein
LTCRANHRHKGIITEIPEFDQARQRMLTNVLHAADGIVSAAARNKRPMACPPLRCSRLNDFTFDVATRWFESVLLWHLTCRANQVHISIIANFVEPVPETAAGFFISRTMLARAARELSRPLR